MIETVRLPDPLTERLPFLEALEEPWERNSVAVLGAWLAFYSLFIFQLARGRGLLPMIDLVFVPIHEGGHLLFHWLGHTMMLLGGTFLQLLVPAALAAIFCFSAPSAGNRVLSILFLRTVPCLLPPTWLTREPRNCRYLRWVIRSLWSTTGSQFSI